MSAPALDGLVVTESRASFGDTVAKLLAAIEHEGMTLVARIDHAAAAASVGLKLRPTTVLIFGNPRAGTPLMQNTPTIAIALPLKLLVWADESGHTWTAHEDPHWLGHRYGVGDGSEPLLTGMAAKLAAIVGATT